MASRDFAAPRRLFVAGSGDYHALVHSRARGLHHLRIADGLGGHEGGEFGRRAGERLDPGRRQALAHIVLLHDDGEFASQPGNDLACVADGANPRKSDGI